MGIGTTYAGVEIVDYTSCCAACAAQRPPSPPPQPPGAPLPPVQPPYPPQPPPTPASPFTNGLPTPYATAASAPADVGAIAAGEFHECKGVVYQGSFCHLKTHYDVIYWPSDHVVVSANQEIMGDYVFAMSAPPPPPHEPIGGSCVEFDTQPYADLAPVGQSEPGMGDPVVAVSFERKCFRPRTLTHMPCPYTAHTHT